MRILSVSPAVRGGGAERVALLLHEGYRARGAEAWLAVATPNAEADGVIAIERDQRRSAWAQSLLRAAWRLQAASVAEGDARALLSRAMRVAAEPSRWLAVVRGSEDFDFPWTEGLASIAPQAPDIVHLHNLHGGYFDIRALPGLSARIPTVITMHDAWLLTGHCAQPLDCERWLDGCGSCPGLSRYVPIRGDRSAANHARKHAAVASSSAALVAPSAWLLSMAERSGLLEGGRVARVIPNAVDTQVFAPGSRADARRRLGLPEDKRIALVVAKDVRTNPYKGWRTLLEALERLSGPVVRELVVVAVGDATGPEGRSAFSAGGCPGIGVRFVDSEATLADYYRAADVLVHPSLADSFPLAPIEAMACGVPVIASDVGGLPEIVVDGVTGLLVQPGSAPELAAAIERLLAYDDLRSRMGDAGLERVRARFALGVQVDSYLALFAELAEGFAIAGRRSQ